MAEYKKGVCGGDDVIIKDGHTMFIQDVIKDLQRKSFLEGEIISLNTEIEKLRANAMPGGHGCCDICDTGGCCKAEEREES